MNKQGLPGPEINYPFLGNLLKMIKNPVTFWKTQKKYGRISFNYVFGNFIYYCTDTDLIRTVLSDSSNNKLQICLNLNGERLLGKNNLAFLQGPIHKSLRNQLLPLFTRKALNRYFIIQKNIIEKHLNKWIKNNKFIVMKDKIRKLNLETSQTVFLGNYLSEIDRKKLSQDYKLMNEGLLAFPINFPGTKLYKAINARKRIIKLLINIVDTAKINKTHDKKCMLNHWLNSIEQKSNYQNLQSLEMAEIILDLLFASQDASSASLTWICHFLSKYPKMKKKILNEVNNNNIIDVNVLKNLKYTNCFVKEVLRFRTPATMIPHKALKNYKLDNITIPKNTLIFPSLWSSSFQGFKNPYNFDPDRFNNVRKEHHIYNKNFLVFGYGPHRCIGYEYATLHLLLFTCLLSTKKFEMKITDKTNNILYGPTIYPADGCYLKFFE